MSEPLLTIYNRHTAACGIPPAVTQAMAMDMWEPYVVLVETHVPRADRKIVFDVFQIMQHMNEALVV